MVLWYSAVQLASSRKSGPMAELRTIASDAFRAIKAHRGPHPARYSKRRLLVKATAAKSDMLNFNVFSAERY